jgi:hypothetical protein
MERTDASFHEGVWLMIDSREKPLVYCKLIAQVLSIVAILFSILPCLCGLVNIGPTIEYSQQTGTNYSLHYLLPCFAAFVIFGLGCVVLIATIVYRPKKE